MKIILNNKKIIEDILKTHIIPEENGVRSVISMMIKLFHEQYLSDKDEEYNTQYNKRVDMNKELRLERKNEGKTFSPIIASEDKNERDYLVEKVKHEMKEFNLKVTVYEEYRFINYIKEQCKLTIGFNRKLRDINCISILKEEGEYINKVGLNDNEKKILFTLFCICKTQSNNGYVCLDYISDTELFKMANVTGTRDKKMGLLYELGCKEIIRTSMKGIYITEYSEIERGDSIDFTIYEFENLGNTFLNKYKEGYKMCDVCGKLIKIKGANQKYCDKCSPVMKKEKNRLNYESRKEKIN